MVIKWKTLLRALFCHFKKLGLQWWGNVYLYKKELWWWQRTLRASVGNVFWYVQYNDTSYSTHHVQKSMVVQWFISFCKCSASKVLRIIVVWSVLHNIAIKTNSQDWNLYAYCTEHRFCVVFMLSPDLHNSFIESGATSTFANKWSYLQVQFSLSEFFLKNLMKDAQN